MYEKLNIIASEIATSVSTTFKNHEKLLKEQSDDLADLFSSMGMADKESIYAHLIDQERAFTEPLDYIDDLRETIKDILKLYNNTNSKNHEMQNKVSMFIAILSSDFHFAIESVKDHIQTLSVNNMNNIDELSRLMSSIFSSAFK
jgi:cell fate (sporulation/competence/biofilm development) regulator YmcA (YheA/YmcA/DUF963 family)